MGFQNTEVETEPRKLLSDLISTYFNRHTTNKKLLKLVEMRFSK